MIGGKRSCGRSTTLSARGRFPASGSSSTSRSGSRTRTAPGPRTSTPTRPRRKSRSARRRDVARWDWAGAIPWVVVQRSDPSIVDEIYAEAVEDFYLDVEAKIYAELSTADPGAATTLGAAIAEFFVATGNERSPELIIMAPDVWGDFADTGALSVALAQAGVDGGRSRRRSPVSRRSRPARSRPAR